MKYLNAKKGKGVLLLLFAILYLQACEDPDKSELVRRLENIFYNESFARIPGRIFSVADYGAVGDGETLSTLEIQKAIDAASEAGGGKLVFPIGTYLSGALFMKSNVELNIGEGVVIKAVQDDSHFPDLWTRVAGIEMNWPAALINVNNQKNVRITGKGVIDGNGKYWWDKFWGDPPRSGGMWTDYIARDLRWAVDYDCKRVRPVVVYESENVLLQDFTVQRAGFWTISMTYSVRVYVNGLVIRNNIGGYGPSSDGINTDSSRDILVENCDIDCNDDNLCIKAGRDADGLRVNRPAENIVYRNCITRSGHGLFTIGSETSGGMRNIEVYGLEAVGTNTGIRFKSAKVRGGLVQDIWFHDIRMKDVQNAFHFELNWNPEFSYPHLPDTFTPENIPPHWKVMTQAVNPPERGIPEFKNILISDIVVENSEQAFYANAYPEKHIHDLVWQNVSVEAEKAGVIRNAKDWKMENVTLNIKNGQPVELSNCTNINIPAFPNLKTSESKIKARQKSIESQINELASAKEPALIIPVLVEENQIINEGDTSLFSENITVYIFPHEESRLNYFEPMGDGFYVSSVQISVTNSAREIAISSERNHNWTFKVRSDEKPQNVYDSDNWQYNPESQFLTIEKTGVSFTLNID